MDKTDLHHLLGKISLLPNDPIVYAIIDKESGACIHIGDGDNFLRVASCITITLGIKTTSLVDQYEARWLPLDTRACNAFQLHEKVRVSGNLERLLQSLHCWQTGRMPQRDKARGTKKSPVKHTGGFLKDVEDAAALYEIYEKLGLQKPDEWPAFQQHVESSADCEKQLAIWAQLKSHEEGAEAGGFFLGHSLRTDNGSPFYVGENHRTLIQKWERCSIAESWKSVSV